MYNWQFGFIWDYRIVFVKGALITIELAALAWTIGVVLGLIIALARLSPFVWLRAPAVLFVETFRSTPALIQLVWIYYAMPIITGLQMSAFTSVAIGLGFHTAAYFGEIFRGGIISIERGQVDAAKSVGMVYWQTMVRIILPQAIRRMLPPFMNETANLVKLTSLGSVLAVYELLHASNNLITNTYRPLEVYTTAAVTFAVIIYPMIHGARMMERYWGARS